jgi:type IV pilus assembly protein PilC
MRHYLPLVLIGLGALVYAWFYFIKTKSGRDFWDSRRIKLPIFGPIAHKICLVRFTRTFASLIRSGVPILEVLQITSQTVGNTIMERAIKAAAIDIERGEGIAVALGKHSVFPSMIIRMISAGEQTGNIDIIVFLGVFIGGMVVCMYLPIFNLGNIVSGNAH